VGVKAVIGMGRTVVIYLSTYSITLKIRAKSGKYKILDDPYGPT
jgi:hypothetical protein